MTAWRRCLCAAGLLVSAMSVGAQSAPGLAPPAPVQADVPLGGADAVRVLVTPRRFTTLAAEIGARIDRLPVAEGGAFAQGDLLIGFDCSTQTAQLARGRAALEAARKTLSANQRLQQLNAVGQLDLDLARAESDKAAADAALAESIVAKCQIVAPFNGRIHEQKVREQQYVQPGQALLEILDDSVLELEFIVPSRWLGWLRPGQAFRVRIDETGRSYPARVLRIGARVDPVSQSIKVVGTVEGRHPDLLAGMSGRATFPPARRSD